MTRTCPTEWRRREPREASSVVDYSFGGIGQRILSARESGGVRAPSALRAAQHSKALHQCVDACIGGGERGIVLREEIGAGWYSESHSQQKPVTSLPKTRQGHGACVAHLAPEMLVQV
jgi:hypothetical protein